jgi:hypothetical protein
MPLVSLMNALLNPGGQPNPTKMGSNPRCVGLKFLTLQSNPTQTTLFQTQGEWG